MLRELAIQNTDVFDRDTARRIGKQVGAYAVLLGTLSFETKRAEANVRLVEIESGRILLAVSYRIYGKSADATRTVDGGSVVAPPRETTVALSREIVVGARRMVSF